MDQNPKKRKTDILKYIPMLFFILIGVLCGMLLAHVVKKGFDEDIPLWNNLLYAAVILAAMYLALFFQLLIHETGHLVFGLISGYKFSSFRIMSFMWVKEDGKLRSKRLTIAGTGGQCLMIPPDMKDGSIPVTLYNLGGSIMNVVASTVFLALYLATAQTGRLSLIFLVFAAVGAIIAIMNGVPMRMGTIDNDGYNAFSLRNNKEALRAFWIQMKINEQVSNGVRLRDMPDEWFALPSDRSMKNSMIATIGVFICNRLMDMKKFREADEMMSHMLGINSGMVGLHRSMMICDRIYVELIGECRRGVLDSMMSEEQKKFMKSMKNFPSIIRTEYVYALLGESDRVKADAVKDRFEKCARKYPYPNEIQSEHELMELAERTAKR